MKAIRLSKITVEEGNLLTDKLKYVPTKLIDKKGEFLQFNNNEFQIVKMTAKEVVSFERFKELYF